jgi:Kef-type K+ transport system membrane component KefB
MDDVFGIAVAFAFCIIITNYSSRFKYLPKVTIYLIIGIITGHSVLNFISAQGVDSLYILKEFAHGIMIFIIGQEFTFAKIKKIEKKVFIASLYEIVITFSLVFAGLYLLSSNIYQSIFAGIIATATAPVSTLVVLREQASEGKLTTFIKGMTGISNLFALVLFISIFPLVNHLVSLPGSAAIKTAQVNLFAGIISVAGSIICGVVLGILISLWEVKEHKDANKVFVVFVAIIAAISLSKIFSLNDLIVFIIMGVSHANTTSKKNELKDLVQKVDLPFYVLFFILTGAYLPLKILSTLSIYGM